MALTLDAIALASCMAAVALVAAAWLGWWEDRSLLLSRLFVALALLGAWWTGAMGLAGTSLGTSSPLVQTSSQLLSGFFGPLLLLFTLAYLGRIERWRAWCILVLLPGTVGSLNFALLAWCVPAATLRTSLDLFLEGVPLMRTPLIDAAPWYLPLQIFHAAQLYLYTLASGVVLLWDARRRRAAGALPPGSTILASIILVVLAAITATDLFGLTGLDEPRRLSPLLAVPLAFLLHGFVRQRVVTARSLLQDDRILRAYLPLAATGGALGTSALSSAKVTQAAVVFGSLRGLSAVAETLEPAELFHWLDRCLAALSETILAQGGIVEEFLADGLLAVFGVPLASDDSCDAALRAAEAMQRVLATLQDSASLVPGAALRMAIGIHFGSVVAGSPGRRSRRSYKVIGDTVNTAQRIEAHSARTEHTILISRAVRDRLEPGRRAACIEIGTVLLAGRSGPVELFGVAARPA